MKSNFLEYQIALLLAQYGKPAVLAALAGKLELSDDQLMALLQNPPTKNVGQRSAKKPRSFDVDSVMGDKNPSKAQLLRILHDRYENRTFLPELRDVRRFFEQSGRPVGSAKSRVSLLPKVMKLLAEREMGELETLTQAPSGSGYSSLGLISDEILRRDR